MVVKISAKNIYLTDSNVYGTASVTTGKDESNEISRKTKPKNDYQNGIIKVSGDSFLEKAIVYNKASCSKKEINTETLDVPGNYNEGCIFAEGGKICKATIINKSKDVRLNKSMNVRGNCNIKSILAEKNVKIDRAEIINQGIDSSSSIQTAKNVKVNIGGNLIVDGVHTKDDAKIKTFIKSNITCNKPC